MAEKSNIKSNKVRINPIQRILEFNRDSLVRQLTNLYGTPSLFDVLDVSRREMSYSWPGLCSTTRVTSSPIFL